MCNRDDVLRMHTKEKKSQNRKNRGRSSSSIESVVLCTIVIASNIGHVHLKKNQSKIREMNQWLKKISHVGDKAKFHEKPLVKMKITSVFSRNFAYYVPKILS